MQAAGPPRAVERLSLARGTEKVHRVPVAAGEFNVQWKIRVEAYSVGFEAQFQPSDGSDSVRVFPYVQLETPSDAWSAHAVVVGPGELRMRWDNSFSRMRGKEVRFTVAVEPLASLPLGYRVGTPLGEGTVIAVRKEQDADEAGSAGEVLTVALPFGTGYFHRRTVRVRQLGFWHALVSRTTLGSKLLFDNEFDEAEAFFAHDRHAMPVFSLAHSTIGFLRALLTMESDLLEDALARVEETRRCVDTFFKQEGALSTLSRLVTWSEAPPVPVADLHAALVTAESQLMGALLLLLQENTVSYVKAGLAVRSGWKLYQRCHRTIVEQRITDPEVVAATYFGVGVFNVVISILPPVVLRLVQVLGFSGDRELGLRLLRECLSLNAIRSPIAAFALLFYHVVLQTYYCTDPAVHIAEAQRVLDVCFKRHPKSVFFWLTAGRLARFRGDIPASIDAFWYAHRCQSQLVQIHHLCYFELAFCHLLRFEWEEAGNLFAQLQEVNSWSKAFYAYVRAACALEMGQRDVAAELMEQVTAYGSRSMGGRAISAEVLVKKRAEQFLAILRGAPRATPRASPVQGSATPAPSEPASGRSTPAFAATPAATPAASPVPSGGAAMAAAAAPYDGPDTVLVLPNLEMLYLFNMFAQLPLPIVHASLARVNATLAQHAGDAAAARDAERATADARAAADAAADAAFTSEALAREGATKLHPARRMSVDEAALCLLMKAKLLGVLGRSDEAEAVYAAMERLAPSVRTARYLLPYSRYDRGLLRLERVKAMVRAGAEAAPSPPSATAAGDGAYPAASSASSAASPAPSSVADTPLASPTPSEQGRTRQSGRVQLLRSAAADDMRAVKSFGEDYLFKVRLHMRVHMAIMDLQGLGERISDTEEAGQEEGSPPREQDL